MHTLIARMATSNRTSLSSPRSRQQHSAALQGVLSHLRLSCCWACTTVYAGSYEYIRRFIVQLSGAEGGHGPDAPSALPIYDLLAGSASGEQQGRHTQSKAAG